MKGGKLIIIVGVLLGLFAGVLVILMMSRQSDSGAPAPTPEPPSVVRALQNIAKGDDIPMDAVQLVRLEAGAPLPPGALADPMKLAGMTAAVDIPQGMILQEGMFYDKEKKVASGESASVLFQPGRVAIAFPVGDLSGVAGALKEGDRVDIVASMEVFDVDPDTQIRLPITGKGEQLPRLLAQLTLQNIEVLRVGVWSGLPAVAKEGENPQAAAPYDVVTLLATQQDALVLTYLRDKADEGQVRVTLLLRSEDDDATVSTEAVTLDYLMKRFNIPVPPKRQETTGQIKSSLEEMR